MDKIPQLKNLLSPHTKYVTSGILCVGLFCPVCADVTEVVKRGDFFMQDNHLAIASVPLQQWGGLYDEKEALVRGTIFKELDKPFFASETKEKKIREAAPKTEEQRSREDVLSQIMETSFVLDDLTLYLDTHMEDGEAISMYRQKTGERNELKKQFAAKFYPLTRNCIADCEKESPFCWQEGPMPWEGACV